MFKKLPLELNEAVFEYLPVKDLVKYLKYAVIYRIIKRKYCWTDLNIIIHYPDLLMYLINIIDKNQALWYSAKYGYIELVKYLINNRAFIHTRSVLDIASSNGHLNVVKYLVSQGADIHQFESSAFKSAMKNGHLEIIKFFVSVGSDVYAGNSDAFIRCAINGHLKVVKYLVEHDVFLNAKNNYVFRNALEYGHLKVVKYLVSLD